VLGTYQHARTRLLETALDWLVATNRAPVYVGVSENGAQFYGRWLREDR
jgi:hypothetical protein